MVPKLLWTLDIYNFLQSVDLLYLNEQTANLKTEFKIVNILGCTDHIVRAIQ